MMSPPGYGPVRRTLLGRRIFVAEADDAAAKSLADMLHSSGCAVIGPATTAQRSVEIIRQTALDGAIVAYQLRDRTATSVMDELSAHRVPFLLTASQSARDIVSQWRPYLLLQRPLLMPQVQTALARMLA